MPARRNALPTIAGRTTLRACVLACSMASGAASVQAQIYAGPADAGGAVVLSNFASEATPLLVVAEDARPAAVAPATPAASASAAATRVRLQEPATTLAELIRRVAKEQRVSESLLKAVIAAESGFDLRAVSPKGARGLMQLMPDTARRWGAVDSFAADQNLRAGASYLRWLLDLFSDDVSLALAGYNAGEGAVMRAGRRVPDIAETRQYVPRVLAYEAHYAGRR